ncbi:MAG: 1-acyl-sn-glycerol-3-phosphate acyltransferase [Gammaproteobacteria bacterium]|nr:1-acyl-sn-glycerol-3-phosphate acyltransferase [Gammaproteobacteria bacterium]MCW9005204.1 1-acyl-sn-glycerol-3-phosphate acyltransferase [Gammaproteobacteria bacterium]MCW9055000.1 1-acyl-sn-glycerol-3-phosphate acyltransferase [Gammaproteobacteria bacterium]
MALLFLRHEIQPNTLTAKLALWWHRRICKIFGVSRTIHGEINQSPTLFVVNHISWFDIPALGSAVPVHFLSKDEINSWPIIGMIAKKAGTLFIKRGARGAAEQSVAEIAQALKNGGHVIIFPEGTTTDGTSVRRFHSRLFQAAIDAEAQIQPVALTYPHPEGVHPKAPFIGDTQFMESTLDMISEKQMDVKLDFLNTINAQQYTRDELASMTQEQILAIINKHKY